MLFVNWIFDLCAKYRMTDFVRGDRETMRNSNPSCTERAGGEMMMVWGVRDVDYCEDDVDVVCACVRVCESVRERRRG